MKNKTMLAAAALLLATGSLGAAELKTESRAVGPFDTIDMRGAAKVDIAVGAAQSVKIEAKPEALEQITTTVQGKTLVIEFKRGAWNWNSDRQGPVHIAITLPKLAGYSLGGAGDTNITGLNGGTTGVALNGAGNVKASGKLESLSLNLNGAGNADLGGVVAGSVTVAVNGAGSANVNATNELTASINGLGSITYDGAPQHLTKLVNGLGSISPAH